MEAHASPTALTANSRPRERVAGPTLVKVGAIGGLAGGIVMAMWQMVVGAIATDPTAVPGIHTSFWTAVTAIPSVPFGEQWFHGSFDFWAVFLGLMGHMMNSAIFGIVGVALVTTALGARPRLLPAMVLGMAYGLLLEVVVVNLIVNQIQDLNTLYTSTPEWSWWVAHAMFGAVLGLVASTLLRRQP